MDNTTIEKNIQTLLVSIKKSSIYKEYKEQKIFAAKAIKQQNIKQR